MEWIRQSRTGNKAKIFELTSPGTQFPSILQPSRGVHRINGNGTGLWRRMASLMQAPRYGRSLTAAQQMSDSDLKLVRISIVRFLYAVLCLSIRFIHPERAIPVASLPAPLHSLFSLRIPIQHTTRRTHIISDASASISPSDKEFFSAFSKT